MRPGPPVGINPVYDRYIDGYEGSGVARSSRGVVELSSSKRVASTGWLMQSVLPTDEAFAPIHEIQRQLVLISLALSLVLGGALGNLIDRVRLGAVVDFLDAHWAGLHFPAFNVADAAITIGVLLLVWQQLTERKTP